MERLGRYELLEELGRGAMGVVYRARDPRIDRLVAIKVIAPVEGLDPAQIQQRRERFQREARAAGRLAHPNIVTVHDVGEEAGRAFLVMELIEGQTLAEVLRTRRPLPLDEVLAVGEQAAQALDYAHRHAIVHRDIKPANILLTRDGVAKVTDFGIARITGTETTQTGQTLGTPSYMSPEQIAGLPLDGRSDIFSLGAVLYELLSGEKAFPGETLGTIIYRIVHEEPIPLRRLNPAFPAGLDVCLKRALAKDPARRYAQAADLARDLREAASGTLRPADAPGATTVKMPAHPRPRPPERRRGPQWPWLAGGGVAVAALVFALALWMRPPQRSPAPHPPSGYPAPPPSQAAEEEAAKAKAAAEDARRPSAGTIQRRGKDNAEMVSIPAGTFTLGDTHGDGEADERPAHRVALQAFWMDRTEVTNGQFAQFARFARDAGIGRGGEWKMEPGKGQHPVVRVPWRVAVAYCRWADKRLPTEAEWEYAARGPDARKYPWGNTWEDSRARFSGNSAGQATAPVGSHPSGASPFGAQDMAGNVWEWVSSLYKAYPYVVTDGRENSTAPGRHVVRGGSWFLNPWDLRSSRREFGEPGYRSAYIGFRCAQS
ncbi:MAG: SUMF1/EgtB/PvdO family nonheme iron enzyme [candidate division NC10 bacterium]|nr:SUMF1/EgtB/PvdO family nonheme iron enzyme [candidate division NC10 bacterium]